MFDFATGAGCHSPATPEGQHPNCEIMQRTTARLHAQRDWWYGEPWGAQPSGRIPCDTTIYRTAFWGLARERFARFGAALAEWPAGRLREGAGAAAEHPTPDRP